jgi:hypothetical protein
MGEAAVESQTFHFLGKIVPGIVTIIDGLRLYWTLRTLKVP